jgi:hypothetical protein
MWSESQAMKVTQANWLHHKDKAWISNLLGTAQRTGLKELDPKIGSNHFLTYVKIPYWSMREETTSVMSFMRRFIDSQKYMCLLKPFTKNPYFMMNFLSSNLS